MVLFAFFVHSIPGAGLIVFGCLLIVCAIFLIKAIYNDDFFIKNTPVNVVSASFFMAVCIAVIIGVFHPTDSFAQAASIIIAFWGFVFSIAAVVVTLPLLQNRIPIITSNSGVITLMVVSILGTVLYAALARAGIMISPESAPGQIMMSFFMGIFPGSAFCYAICAMPTMLRDARAASLSEKEQENSTDQSSPVIRSQGRKEKEVPVITKTDPKRIEYRPDE